MVKLLLAKGAKFDQVNNDGVTPLSVSRENGHDEVVKLLLAHIAKEEQTKRAEEKKEEVGTPKKRAMRACEKCGKEAEKMKKCSVCKLVRY